MLLTSIICKQKIAERVVSSITYIHSLAYTVVIKSFLSFSHTHPSTYIPISLIRTRQFTERTKTLKKKISKHQAHTRDGDYIS